MDDKFSTGGEEPPVAQLNNDENLKPVDETSSIDFVFSDSENDAINTSNLDLSSNQEFKENNGSTIDKSKIINEDLNISGILEENEELSNNSEIGNVSAENFNTQNEIISQNESNNESLKETPSYIDTLGSETVEDNSLSTDNFESNNLNSERSEINKNNSELTAEDYNVDPEFNVYHSSVHDDSRKINYTPELDEYSWSGAENERILNNKTIFVGVPQTKPINWWLAFTIVVGIYFITSLFTFNILLMPVMVEGASMEPTINNNVGATKYDVVYLQRTQKVEKNDIIVIDATNYDSSSESKSFIKRVVATGGDTIQFVRHSKKLYWVSTGGGLGVYYAEYVLYLNGERLNEDYITTKIDSLANLQSKAYGNLIYEEDTETGVRNELDLTTESDEAGVMILAFQAVEKEVFYNTKVVSESVINVPKGKVFVLGDNRTISNDSKYFGLVSVDDIIGKVKIHKTYDSGLLPAIFYSIKKGYLF